MSVAWFTDEAMRTQGVAFPATSLDERSDGSIPGVTDAGGAYYAGLPAYAYHRLSDPRTSHRLCLDVDTGFVACSSPGL